VQNHTVAWRVNGPLTKLNLYYSWNYKCLQGIKATYGSSVSFELYGGASPAFGAAARAQRCRDAAAPRNVVGSSMQAGVPSLCTDLGANRVCTAGRQRTHDWH
jgi:hypothetical protein